MSQSPAAQWAHIIGEGYVCALPIANYQVGFVIMAKIGEVAERLDYYPTVTLEQHRIKLVVPDTNTEKAEAIAEVVENFLPKPTAAPEPGPEVSMKKKSHAAKKPIKKTTN